MPKTVVNLKDLSKLLSPFFDEDFNLSQHMLYMSGEFIFNGTTAFQLNKFPKLVETLEYLRDVTLRNHFKELDDLVKYYESKQQRIEQLFDRFEGATEEEKFALRFENACKTYLKVERVLSESKACLYYPIHSESNYVVGFENISYGDSYEVEKQYLAQVKGNQLINQQTVCSVSGEQIDPHVAN
jgi:hypothetical protein